MSKLSFPGLTVQQGSRIFYSAVAMVGVLIDNCKVDRWEKNRHEEGYQRAESESRAEEFANYLLNDELKKIGVNLIDQTLLVNVRGTIRERDGFVFVDGEMFVVDGQHRLAGLRIACETYNELKSYTVPIVLLNVDSNTERARFYVINEKAKGVPTDLVARQLLQLEPDVAKLIKSRFEPEFVKKATEIVDALDRGGGVWSGKLITRGAEPKREGFSISEASFMKSLKAVLEDPRTKHLSAYDSGVLLEKFWSALAQLCPDSTSDPKNHLLMKTAGVLAVNRVLPDVVAVAMSRGAKIREISIDQMKDIIAAAPEMRDSFWTRENQEGAKRFLGEGGASDLAKQISANLPQPTD
jgi:DGQHR domain-containing protein